MKSTATKAGRPLERFDVGAPSAAVRAAIEAMALKGSIPGLSLTVVNRDKVLLAGGYGLADRLENSPATASTAYLWFSMTKIVTATAVLRLADEGHVDVDAPASEYVPYLRSPRAVQPTVRHLLNHTAGLANPMPIRWVHPASEEGQDPDVLLRRLMSRPRAYRNPPGQTATYSNVGYLALGAIIGAAAGMPYETYIEESILQPLGMTGTGFIYGPSWDRATGYVRSPRLADPLLRRVLPHGVPGKRSGAFLGLNPFYVDGPAYGGLVGDVVDAGRFLRMHLRDGELDGRRVLQTETARRMRIIDQSGKPFSHGLGWFRRPTTSEETWVEHFGAGAGFWNVMRLYPERGIGVAVMANSTSTYDFEPLFAGLAGASWS
jgi:CubicO group peptidase (beta-lactamase class C family)